VDPTKPGGAGGSSRLVASGDLPGQLYDFFRLTVPIRDVGGRSRGKGARGGIRYIRRTCIGCPDGIGTYTYDRKPGEVDNETDLSRAAVSPARRSPVSGTGHQCTVFDVSGTAPSGADPGPQPTMQSGSR
jgi:hypothetical protein